MTDRAEDWDGLAAPTLEGAGRPARAERLEDLQARFAAFVESRFERARRTAWRMIGGDGAAAEDVAQDAFVKAYRGLHRFRSDSTLETWFFRILIREAQNHRRWRAVRTLWTPPAHDGVIEAAPDLANAAPGDPILRRRIAAAIDALSPMQRDVFVLVVEEGFTHREAAGMLGRSEGTIKTHARRAGEALRHALRDVAEGAPLRDVRDGKRDAQPDAMTDATTDAMREGGVEG